MKHVRFVSRRLAADYVPAPRSVLISIHDRREKPLVPQDGWADVLVQRYHDTDGSLMGLEVFSEDQAREVLDFVERNRTCVELVVHCQVGQSRSAAVALYLAEKYDVPCYQQDSVVNLGTYRLYNRLVYQRLRTVDSLAPGAGARHVS